MTMCGRYVCVEDESVDLAALYRELRVTHPGVMLKSGEIRPADCVPLLCFGGAARTLCPAPGIWGFEHEAGRHLTIHARAETAAEKPLFRDCFYRRRCVVPTLGYFEWSPSKAKYRFLAPRTDAYLPASAERTAPVEAITYLAGLWRPTAVGVRFVIMTTAANTSTASIHPRMPVVLMPHQINRWVQDAAYAAAYLRTAMPPMRCRPA